MEANNTGGRCPHLKPHEKNVECDKKRKEAYGWEKGVGCYYFSDQECISLSK